MRAAPVYTDVLIPGVDWTATQQVPSSDCFNPASASGDELRSRDPNNTEFVQPDFFGGLDACIAEIELPQNPKEYLRNADLLTRLFAAKEQDERLALRNHLIEANQGLVHSIARRFTSRRNGSMMELAAEGQLGLMNAITKCDPAKVSSFGAFAAFHITCAIRSFIRQKFEAVLPEHANKRVLSVRRAISSLAAKEGIDAANIDAAAQRFSDEEIGAKAKVCPGTVRTLRPHLVGVTSIHAPRAEGNNATLADELADDALRPDEICAADDDRSNSHERLMAALDRLPIKRAAVLKMYFGLEGRQAMNSTQIAGKLGISKTRVTFVIRKCLEQLRGEMA